MILPLNGTAWRNQIDHWFDTQSIRPRVVAEFADSALLKTAAADGLGITTVALPHGSQGYVPHDLHLITVERALRHLGAQTIAKEAKKCFPGEEVTPPLRAK